MPHLYSSKGAEMPSSDFVIPSGEYIWRIAEVKETKSKSGDYQVVCRIIVVDGEKKGFPINFHRVTFLEDNARARGMAIHFLKTIGQPWEGDFQVDPSHWVGKCFLGYAVQNDYNGTKSMQIKWIKALDKAKEEEFSEIPF